MNDKKCDCDLPQGRLPDAPSPGLTDLKTRLAHELAQQRRLLQMSKARLPKGPGIDRDGWPNRSQQSGSF